MAEPTMATRAVYCGSAAWRRRIVANPQKRNGANGEEPETGPRRRQHAFRECASPAPASARGRPPRGRRRPIIKLSDSWDSSSSIAAKALTAAAAAGLPPRDVVFVMQQRPLSHRASFASRAPTSPTGKPTTAPAAARRRRTISRIFHSAVGALPTATIAPVQPRPQRLHRRRRPRACAACAAARTSGRSIAQRVSLRTLVRPAWSIFTSQRIALPAANAARPRSTASG